MIGIHDELIERAGPRAVIGAGESGAVVLMRSSPRWHDLSGALRQHVC